jgi:2,4-dienoyl-CoA reductase-like NADH-dependent reductase (Old Yellow Enzyme family)
MFAHFAVRRPNPAMSDTHLLSSPIALGSHTVRNRLVMPPMVLFEKAGVGWRPSAAHVDYYGIRARAGIGLVVVEATAIAPEGRLAAFQLRAWDDAHVPELAKLASAIRAGGATGLVQIHHAGAESSSKAVEGATLVSPSGVKALRPNADTPRELTAEEISELPAAYARAAVRCMAAGFDGVELHGAHGYLLSQFLSPAFNKREDAWGGESVSDRMALPLAVVRAVREAVGPEAMVNYRLGAIECFEGGLTLHDGVEAARLLAQTGCIDALNVSNGAGGGDWPPLPNGFHFSHRMFVAANVRKAVTIPVIGVGGVKTGTEAERALAEGVCDMVAVGTALLADPEWARSALAGDDAGIAPCRSCRPCAFFSDGSKCPQGRKRQGL